MELNAASMAGMAPVQASALTPSLRVGQWLRSLALQGTLAGLLLLAWLVWYRLPYTSGSRIGYWLGVLGGSLMLGLLIYPLRKRMRWLSALGPLRHWFRFHLLAGIAGPVIILFHATFRVGSFNATIALGSMLLVVASGIVGRYIYRKIHHGLYGSRASAVELQKAVAEQLQVLQPVLESFPLLVRELDAFTALVAAEPQGRWQRTLHFTTLGLRRMVVVVRLRRIMRQHESHAAISGNATATGTHLYQLINTIDQALQAIQRTAQFSTYERLFSLWHVVHIPFLCMLLLTAVVHVVAVHAY